MMCKFQSNKIRKKDIKSRQGSGKKPFCKQAGVSLANTLFDKGTEAAIDMPRSSVPAGVAPK